MTDVVNESKRAIETLAWCGVWFVGAASFVEAVARITSQRCPIGLGLPNGATTGRLRNPSKFQRTERAHPLGKSTYEYVSRRRAPSRRESALRPGRDARHRPRHATNGRCPRRS
jgi:hypothetical protein